MNEGFNRRELLACVGAGGIVLLASRDLALAEAARRARPVDGGPWFFLTQAEATFLAAACDRLIPPDEHPGAVEAGVVDYIDLQLATGWGAGEDLYLQEPLLPGRATPEQGWQHEAPAPFYRRCIAALEERLGGAGAFAQAAPEAQDEALRALEAGDLDDDDLPGATFFEQLRRNTVEGFFADPVYGGNRGYAGWAMIGFPGAHAYYLTEVDRWNMDYRRPPSGIAHAPGRGTPDFRAPVSAADRGRG